MYEDYSLEFSSNKLEYNVSSLDLINSNKKEKERKKIKNNNNKRQYI